MTTKQTMKRFEYFLGSFAPFRSFGWNVPGTTTHQSTTKTRKPGNFNICAKLFATKISDILLSLKFSKWNHKQPLNFFIWIFLWIFVLCFVFFLPF